MPKKTIKPDYLNPNFEYNEAVNTARILLEDVKINGGWTREELFERISLLNYRKPLVDDDFEKIFEENSENLDGLEEEISTEYGIDLNSDKLYSIGSKPALYIVEGFKRTDLESLSHEFKTRIPCGKYGGVFKVVTSNTPEE